MEEKRTSAFENALIWFGAGVSIAEIITGTYFAPLGFKTGLLAILLGHLIGGIMMFLAGLIGARTRLCAMDTVKLSFGSAGGSMFAVLNIMQLVGWTAIMIYDGSLACAGIFSGGAWIWCLVIGALIALWIVIGIKNLGKVNTVAMAALFILTIILCRIIFFSGSAPVSVSGEGMSFGAAVELAVAMPLSWLPLISDYTREAEKPARATLASVVTYILVSCWMYVIGMGAAIFTGESDIAQIMLKAGLSIAALIIVVFSTVTTTFLDAFSAGISCQAVTARINGKYAALAVTAVGTAAAMIWPMDNITGFLYLIGSVFAPMIAVQTADYFILHRDSRGKTLDVPNLVIWLAGLVFYRLLMSFAGAPGGSTSPVGYTAVDMVVTSLVCVAYRKLTGAHPAHAEAKQ
jgi:putative hydroxymethylpyrimidine transporter CytX